jgi:DNA-binding Lrp family transcriptional regulator
MTHSPTPEDTIAAAALDALDRRLLDDFQRDFPLDPRPFTALAERLGVSEADVLERLHRLQAQGAISRVGAVLTPHRAGCSTLAAMAVPDDELDEVAGLVSGYPEVNHNYEREHELNLWFVVTAPNRERLEAVLGEIETRTRLPVLELPLLDAYRLDLGFALSWS